MKTMQAIQEMQESKDRVCVAVWHEGRWADFRETSKDFSQEDVSKLSQEKGAA